MKPSGPTASAEENRAGRPCRRGAAAARDVRYGAATRSALSPPRYPQRVLMTADAVGGVWQYALALAAGLAAHRIEVLVATMGPRPDAAQRAEVAALKRVKLRESDFRLEWMPSSSSDVRRAGDWLLDLETQFVPDVVHLNGFAHGALPWSAPTLVVGHSCVLSWWTAVRGGEAPADWAPYRDAVAAGLHASDAVAAPSRAMLAALEHHYGRIAGGEVIPNGRDPAHFAPAPKEPFVLAVGRLWDEAKNAQALADIAPKIAWPVRLAGDATAPDGTTRPLSNVEVLGRCRADLMAGLYGRASIYALPARYEPFGLSVLEAALSGCALVLGDIPSLRENWDGAAAFVPPADREALRDTLNSLIRDSRRREELAARARKRAGRFTAAAMVQRYLSRYRRLLAPQPYAPAAHFA
jgi:glycogen synthase